jgi:hypothetical protein
MLTFIIAVRFGYPLWHVREFPRGESTLSEDKVRVRGLSEDRPLVGKAHGAERRGEQCFGRQSYLDNRLFNSQFFINPEECYI